MRFHVATIGAFALLVVGCAQPPAAPPKPDLATEEKAIRDLDARWQELVRARDAAGDAAMYASDGVAYRSHVEPLVGPAAIQAYSTKFYADNPKANITWITEAVRVAESGDLAVQTGATHITGLGAKGDAEDRIRFVTVWRKVNGEWKAAHDIGSTTMPEASQTTKQ